MKTFGLLPRSPNANPRSQAIYARCEPGVGRWAIPVMLIFGLTLTACGGGGSGPDTEPNVTCFSSSTTSGNCLLKQFTDDPVEPNSTVTLEFTLSHDPNAQARTTGISFSDDLNAVLPGLTATGLPISDVCGNGSQLSGTSNLTLTGGSLAPGATCSFSVMLQVPADASAGFHTNTTSNVTAMVAGQPASASPATDELEIIGLSFVKSFTDDPVLPNAPATLEFTITNTDLTFSATAISFSDDLNAALPGLVAVGLPTNDVCGAGSQLSGTSLLTLSGGSLASGAACTFSVTLLTPNVAFGTNVTNTTSPLTGTIDGAGVSSDPASAILQFVSPPSFSKSFAPASIETGGISIVSFTIENTTSPQAASNLDFTDNFPAGMVIATPGNASTTCTGGTLTGIQGSGVVSYTGATIAANASCTTSIDVTSSVTGTLVNITGDLTSSFGSSGSASATLQVLDPP